MSRKTQLRVYWSKREQDFVLAHPAGIGTKSDAHWLAIGVFTDQFKQELLARGYDPTTVKFSVEIDFEGPRAESKFPTLTAERREAPDGSPEGV